MATVEDWMRKKLRNSWCNMKQRCHNQNNPDYVRYGGRGIRVAFNRFEHFARHVGYPPHRKMSIDRVDNDGDYRHGNLRWATAKEQAANRRGARKEKWVQLELML